MDVRDIIELSNETATIETRVDISDYKIKMIINPIDEKDPTTKHKKIQLKKLCTELRKIIETTTKMTDIINSLHHKEIKPKYKTYPLHSEKLKFISEELNSIKQDKTQSESESENESDNESDNESESESEEKSKPSYPTWMHQETLKGAKRVQPNHFPWMWAPRSPEIINVIKAPQHLIPRKDSKK